MELETNFVKLFLVQNEEPQEVDLNSPEWKELYEYETNRAIVPPSPNNPPWSSGMAFGMWAVSIAAIIFFPFLFLLPYIGKITSDGSGSLASLESDPNAIILNIIAIIPAHIFTIIVAYYIVTKNRTLSYKQTLGWTHDNFRWFYYILILIGFFAVAGVVMHFLPEQDNGLMRILRSSRTATLLVAFMATFTAPLVEEVVYRGVMYSAFQRSFGVSGAVGMVTFLFAAVHVPQYWGSPGTILMICLLSLILTLVRVKTDSLLPCVILHTIFNGFQSILLVLEPYLPKELTEPEQKAAAIFRLFS